MNWLARTLLTWFDTHGRQHLPWQQDRTAYRVWVSEIMLQQTQVATVIGYYERFMARFPTVQSLAAAKLDEVLHLWTGLGYYARGRNLHKAARRIVAECDGEFPLGAAALAQLPGIGPSTAGAIAAIAQDQHAAILDGNVKRVLARYHAVDGYPGETRVRKRLWHFAHYHTPRRRTGAYTQAIMDLGATLCTARDPACSRCPLARRCEALALDRVADFPTRKRSRTKPLRRVRMWLFVDPEGACLLLQRPSSGLWGSLWTPPEAPPDEPLLTQRDTIAAAHGLVRSQLSTPVPLAPFRHTFTHFKLDIEPFKVAVAPVRRAVVGDVMVRDAAAALWYRGDRGTQIGLAKPTQTLLQMAAQTLPRLQSSRAER